MSARVATLDDVDGVHALLNQVGMSVERASLARRAEGPDSGIVLANTATISWALDGAALHLYDIAGAHEDIRALLDLVAAIARDHLIIVLVCTRYEDDPLIAMLEAAGFVRDWEEPDVQAGRVRNLITLLRVLEDE